MTLTFNHNRTIQYKEENGKRYQRRYDKRMGEHGQWKLMQTEEEKAKEREDRKKQNAGFTFLTYPVVFY